MSLGTYLATGYFVQYAYMGTIWKGFTAGLGLHWGSIILTLCEVMLWLHYSYVVTALWLLHQPGERLCYGHHAHQDRINVSAVPMAPRVFSQPLS